MLETTAAGSYPVPEAADDPLRAVLDDQAGAGLDLLNDGLLDWDDPVSFFMERMDGVEPGPSASYFSRPMTYRKPKVHMTAVWQGSIASPAFRAARERTDRPLKAVITGPFTLAACSEMMEGSYNDLGEFAFDLARSMAREVEELADAGAAAIQIDEPGLLRRPEHVETVRDCVELLKDFAGGVELILKLHWGEIAPLFDDLMQIPADTFDLDFVSDPDLADRVASEGSPRPLDLAILDSRTATLEDEAETLRRLERLLRSLDPAMTRLTLNGGFRPFLTRSESRAKLQHLTQLRQRFLGA